MTGAVVEGGTIEPVEADVETDVVVVDVLSERRRFEALIT